MKRILSLGAGVQSSTLALMMARGEVEPVECAIFADTGAEPGSVYRWLDWLEAQLPFPVHRVSRGNLRDAVLARAAKQKAKANPPFFTESGMLPRQCTEDYKLVPIQRKLRELCGLVPRQRAPNEVLAEVVIGISFDEALRQKPSRLDYIRHVFPLVERRLTRWHCLEWMQARGYPAPPKSACTFCPYRSDEGWQTMKREDPAAFADAVAVDEAIRDGFSRTRQKLYVHRSLRPLAEADLRTAAEFGQVDAFGNECAGMCGV